MPFAINIRSDDSSSDHIRALWRRCASLEDEPSMESMNYPPHLTLAIYDDIDLDDLVSAFDFAIGDMKKQTIVFERLGYFDAPDSVILWAAPSLPPEVSGFHDRIHQALGAGTCRPNYRPGAWMPHCSLAIAIDPHRRNEAVDLATARIQPFEVTFDVADCASFHPVEVIHEKSLRSVA